MASFPGLVIGLYLLLLIAAGWWLVVGGHPSVLKVALIVLFACSLPAVLVLPELVRPNRTFADLALALGLALLICGGAALSLGAGAGWLWRRRR
ncbi:MAG: hypothetical protein AB7E60_12760 [Sphingobium sp.]